MPRLQVFKQLECVEESDEEYDEQDEILKAFQANMDMIKNQTMADFTLSLPKVEKSPSEDGFSVLNTTQDSSLSEDSGSKRNCASLSGRTSTDNSIGEIHQQDIELEMA